MKSELRTRFPTCEPKAAVSISHPDVRVRVMPASTCRSGKITAEQITGTLQEAKVRLSQGDKTGAICRSFGMSEQNYYRWRREYGA